MTSLRLVVSGMFLLVVVLVLAACGDSNKSKELTAEDKAELEEMLTYIKSNLVFIQGGTYSMGRYSNRNGYAKNYFGDNDIYFYPSIGFNEPYEVTLSDFYISNRLITNEEYNLFARLKGIDINEDFKNLTEFDFIKVSSMNPMSSASLYWSRAEPYCSWLAEQTGLPFALPTEAQWEYVARNRGQDVLNLTNNGYVVENYNFPSSDEIETYSQKYRVAYRKNLPKEKQSDISYYEVKLAVDQYQPNPLGVYFVVGGSFRQKREIVNDFYQKDYFDTRPAMSLNPTGPNMPNPNDEVRRVTRYGPYYRDSVISSVPDMAYSRDYGARCVVNKSNIDID